MVIALKTIKKTESVVNAHINPQKASICEKRQSKSIKGSARYKNIVKNMLITTRKKKNITGTSSYSGAAVSYEVTLIGYNRCER